MNFLQQKMHEERHSEFKMYNFIDSLKVPKILILALHIRVILQLTYSLEKNTKTHKPNNLRKNQI